MKKIKEKLKALANKIKDAAIRLYYWILNHKDEAIAVVFVVVTVISGITKFVKMVTPTQYERERRRIDHTWYDPHTGIAWELKKKPTNRQKEVIDEASRTKVPMGPILRQLHLI